MLYRVGTKKFSNKFLAFEESQKTGQTLKFDLYEDAFDLADWSVDPVQTWDELLDIRANQIAAMKKPIILGFSGGTDSLTIYRVFERNKIPITAMHLRSKNDPLEISMYQDVLPFIEQERQKHGFKFIHTQETVETLNEFYCDPDWCFGDLPVRLNFSTMAEHQAVERNSFLNVGIDPDYVYVTGLDKPRHKVINNKFFIYQFDTTFNNYGDPRLDHFFISPQLPELHIKQSYMLARYIVSLSMQQQKPLSSYNNIHNPRHFNYWDYSMIGCGRFGDIADSAKQKLMNRESYLYLPRLATDEVRYRGRSQLTLLNGIRQQERFAQNYINGIRTLKADSVIGKIFTEPENLYSVAEIESKNYQLNI